MQTIRAALANDPGTNEASIYVAAKDGMVTLSGQVTPVGQKDVPQQLVAQIDGVKSVENHLKVRSD